MQARHYSQLYRRLRDLDPEDHQRVIRVYEEQETEIGRLDTLEYFELTVYYVDALFATGAYRQHLMVVDRVIEACMRENIISVEGIGGDIFQHLLFRKAVSAFRLRNYSLAIHIAEELIRIAPASDLYPRFLRVVLFKSATTLLQMGRAGFIFCVLLAAFMITLNLLVITNFYPALVGEVNLAIGLVFFSGLVCLVGMYGYAYFSADRRAYRFNGAQTNK